MSFDPESPMTDGGMTPAESSDISRNGFEIFMVAIGSLVTYMAVSAVKCSCSAVCRAVKRMKKGVRPFFAAIKRNILCGLKRIGVSFVDLADGISDSNKKFAERMTEVGFGKAVSMQLSDVLTSMRNSGKFAATVVNHAVPVLCIGFLVWVVTDKTSTDYGVTVEYNGQEIGVVSEESIIDEAQQVVADRTDYYDTGSDTYITATLSLKPLSAHDSVIDEQVLAAAIQEQIEIMGPEESDAPEETAEEEVPAEEEDHSDKVRAFMVTVNGEFVGAVEANDEIADYLDSLKSEYMTDEIVDVSFDKNIEYTYENYVMPSQIVDQDEIIDLLGSIVSEPVYYEIQLGDTPWDIAVDNGLTLDQLQDCSITFDGEEIDDITEFCPVGAKVQLSEELPYLGVMTTKEMTYSEEIDYEIIQTDDPDMYMGETEVDVEGVEGEKSVTAYVTYKNDTVVSREVISETVISEPIDEQIRVGTRETKTPVSTGSGGSGEYFWPVDGGYISSYQGDGRGHKGIDIAAPYGTPIYAAESGTVVEADGGWNGGYGNCIRISHSDGNVTVYGHQSSLAVEYGDYVVKGQLIGYVGSTGDSSGNHLHFEVRSNGTYPDPLDYVSQY